MLEEREELLKMELKIQEQDARPQPRAAALSSPSAATSAPGHDEEAALMSSMARPTMASLSSSSTMPSSSRNAGINFVAIPESSAHRHAYASMSAPTGNASLHLDSSEVHANMAMISDGSRYNGGNHRVDSSQLPPYSPGNQQTMNGHGSENNDTRLSEYVKGGTKAQDIKDSGNF